MATFKLFEMTLPFDPRDGQGQPVTLDLGESLVPNASPQGGAWQGTLSLAAPVSTLTVCAPIGATLSYAQVGGADQYTFDSTAFSGILRDLILPQQNVTDPYLPLPGKLILTGALDTSTFMPTSAAKRSSRRNNITVVAAAAKLLTSLKAGNSLPVLPGEVLGQVKNATITVSFSLRDGSSIPLSLFYTYIAAIAPGLLATSTQAHPWITAQRRDHFLDLIVPENGNLFELLPAAGATGVFQCTLAGSLAPLTLAVKPNARRFVFPTISAQGAPATTATLALTVTGAGIPLHDAEQPNATTSSTNLPGAIDVDLTASPGIPHPIFIGPSGASLVVTSPKMTPAAPGSAWKAVCAISAATSTPNTASVPFEGISGGSTVNATVTSANGNTPLGPFAVSATRWATGVLSLPTNQGVLTIEFTDDQSASEKIMAAPVTIQMGKLRAALPGEAKPVVELTSVIDDVDALQLQASIGGAADLAAGFGGGTFTVDWNLEVRTVAAAHAMPENGGVPDIPAATLAAWQTLWPPDENGKENPRLKAYCHWMPFRMTASTGDTPVAIATPWDPPSLATDRNSLNTATANADLANYNLMKSAWRGNHGINAGPVVGNAMINANIRKDNVVVLTVPGFEFQVEGYDSSTLACSDFVARVQDSISKSFGGGFPNQAALNLTANNHTAVEQLTKIMLTLLLHESFMLHFASIHTPQANWRSDKIKAVFAQNPGFDAIWPAGYPLLCPTLAADNYVPGMPKLGPPADCGLAQVSSRPSFDEMYDWKFNLDIGVSILFDCFSNVRAYLLQKEVVRLNGPAGYFTGKNTDKLNSYLDAVMNNPGMLWWSIVSRYNGPWAIPYWSTLTWVDNDFVPDPQQALPYTDQNFKDPNGYFRRIPTYFAFLLNSIVLPDHHGRLATAGDLARAVFTQALP